MKKPKQPSRARRSAGPRGSTCVEFNINDHVQVKLTPYGLGCLRENYEKLKASCGGSLPFKFSAPKTDKDGWSRWQALSLMEDLGPHIHIGLNIPFETTIRVEVKSNHSITGKDAS